MVLEIRLRHAGFGVFAVLLAGTLATAGTSFRLADAAQRGDKDAVRALLKQKAEVNAPQPDGATALSWAVHHNDLDMADLLIRAGAHVNAANDLGVTPLWLACEN